MYERFETVTNTNIQMKEKKSINTVMVMLRGKSGKVVSRVCCEKKCIVNYGELWCNKSRYAVIDFVSLV